ncbi:class I lanthipeptide [Taibaiella koreensis]|uniref:class I lanthipeptide n=1 Tax=Taibaiella koreensis TaxID=1268548 RepID=UPI000E59E39C|nr:class I lanthipeptide [Taibaiella koreensis]
MKKKGISLKAKLTLNKETLAQLNQRQQAVVAGGGTLSRCQTNRTCAPQNTGFVSCEGMC